MSVRVAGHLLCSWGMLRLAAVVLVSGCALYADGDPIDEPDAFSAVTYFEIPQYSPTPVDILFVIDDSPTMATDRANVLANTARIAARIDEIDHYGGGLLHIGVITSDLADRGVLVGGRFWSMQWNPDRTAWHDFDGELSDVLKLDVGITGSVSQPLAALDLALADGTNPGFRQADAALLVIPITNRDDDSTGAVDDYLTNVKPYQVLVSGIYSRPAPRLDAFLARFPSGSHFTPITDADLTPAISYLQYFFKDLLGLKCFDEPLVMPFECAISDVDQDGVELQLMRACDANTSVKPCWTIYPQPQLCTYGSGLTIDVKRSVWPARGTRLVGQCATRFLAN